MREILFRGKRKDNGDWVEGSAINTQYDVRGKEHIYIGILIESEMYPLMRTIDWHEIIPETVGQYTGRKDMHGTKIFEGDIVVGISGEGYVCFWDECNYEFGIKNDQYSCSLAQASYYTTVADNIHDIKLFGGKGE